MYRYLPDNEKQYGILQAIIRPAGFSRLTKLLIFHDFHGPFQFVKTVLYLCPYDFWSILKYPCTINIPHSDYSGPVYIGIGFTDILRNLAAASPMIMRLCNTESYVLGSVINLSQEIPRV